MTTRPTTRIAALLAATTTLVGAFAACGDTNTTVINANCGAGTTLKDGVCVPVTDATTDTGVADTGTSTDAQIASDGQASTGDSGTAPDVDGGAEDPTPDDPCPLPDPTKEWETINCDPKCVATSGPIDARCLASTCSSSPPTLPANKASWDAMFHVNAQAGDSTVAVRKFRIRLPRNPAEALRTCSPKIAEADYPNQLPRPGFMLGFHTSHFDVDFRLDCVPAPQTQTLAYVASAPRPYGIGIFRSDDVPPQSSRRPWEVLLTPLSTGKATATGSCDLAPCISEVGALPATPYLRGFIFYVDGKVAAKNIEVRGQTLPSSNCN